jgi:hypothetical protein
MWKNKFRRAMPGDYWKFVVGAAMRAIGAAIAIAAPTRA